MKTLKKITVLFMLSLALMSCDDVINEIQEKDCGIFIENLEEEYQENINTIRNNTELTEEEISDQLIALQDRYEEAREELLRSCEEDLI
ncbi:hypothetical protein [Formosa haliotis]|uniref:hypothetical protein n=1 Tax=Formosa haliotis TaxID=1555194 RepID=UPI000826361C|nr:hypothetical protein [Formosa haliotis]